MREIERGEREGERTKEGDERLKGKKAIDRERERRELSRI